MQATRSGLLFGIYWSALNSEGRWKEVQNCTIFDSSTVGEEGCSIEEEDGKDDGICFVVENRGRDLLKLRECVAYDNKQGENEYEGDKGDDDKGDDKKYVIIIDYILFKNE